MELLSRSQVVQQLDRDQGDAGANDCLHKTPYEFAVTGHREAEHRDNGWK